MTTFALRRASAVWFAVCHTTHARRNDSNWSPAVYKKCCYVCESFLCSFEHLLASDSAMAFATTHEGTLEKAFQPLIEYERPARERSRDPTDIEAQIEEIQARRRAGLAEGEEEGESGGDKVGLNSLGHFDMNVYSSGDKSGYVTSIPANEEEDVSRSKFIGRPVEKFTFVRDFLRCALIGIISYCRRRRKIWVWPRPLGVPPTMPPVMSWLTYPPTTRY